MWPFFFEICDFNLLAILLLFLFFLNLHKFFQFLFPTIVAKLEIFETKKHVGYRGKGEGVFNYLSSKFHQTKLLLFLRRKTKCKIYFYISKINK
jgi:hypothetical protein